MIKKTVYRKLREFKKNFRWANEFGEIRGYSRKKAAKGIRFCPLTALHYVINDEILDADDYNEAATALGISKEDADHIVLVADYTVDAQEGGKVSARLNLLKSLGLKEVPA